MAAGESSSENSGLASEAKALDLTSPDEVKQWTEGFCKGWTLTDLAQSVKVEPTIDAVVRFLSQGFPSQAKAIVQEVCTQELDRMHRQEASD